MNKTFAACAQCLSLAFCLCSPIPPTSAQELAALVLVDHPRIDSRLTDIQNRLMTCATAAGTRQFELDQIVCWGWWRESARGPQIVLKDGSVLVGDPTAMRAADIAVTTALFGELMLPRESVAGVIFRPPTDVIERDRVLRDLIGVRRARNSVWMFNGDELDGIAVSDGGTPPGALLTTLHVGQSNTVAEIENVVAVACPWTDLRSPSDSPAALWIGLRDGTRLAVLQLASADGRVNLRLRSGEFVTALASQFWPQVTWVQPAASRFTFLSDQPTAGFKHIPLLSTNWNLGVDRNVLGTGLRSAGRNYAKGLGMHSAARSAYNLGRRFRSFEADIALDDAAQARGSVVFRVFLDRAPAGEPPQWKLDYESPGIRGGAPPIPIRVDVSDAERLALVVDFAERGDECDYANWLLARLVP